MWKSTSGPMHWADDKFVGTWRKYRRLDLFIAKRFGLFTCLAQDRDRAYLPLEMIFSRGFIYGDSWARKTNF